ncbi:IclR family transcriptional regulator [Bradyrhizobium sp. 191]|uniref:IclR family transcriptional regulator n=1 Tax=Bradyrhizobium sp. 191 TaxID=2782659 RepID=UPI001FFF6256|nr:IclR family transcriptional regulator [Bradyrhizobium sp. 191]UPJ63686.1 IclR family transcriptional regulator [Bradyrhizobium sp. 191]
MIIEPDRTSSGTGDNRMSKSQSLERGLEILEAVNHAERPIGTRELARLLELSPAIVQRLVNTLAERHYLQRDPDTKRYTIGYQTLIFGASLMRRDNLLVEARKELEEVTRKLRVDSYMATLQGRQAIYLMCLAGDAPVSVRAEAGDVLSLHSTAIGRCILSSFPDEKVLEILGPGPLRPITKKTITDPHLLLNEIHLTRERGFAVVQNENIEGIISVGALIEQPAAGPRTAISLSFSPYFSKDIDIEEATAVITAAARRISRIAVS